MGRAARHDRRTARKDRDPARGLREDPAQTRRTYRRTSFSERLTVAFEGRMMESLVSQSDAEENSVLEIIRDCVDAELPRRIDRFRKAEAARRRRRKAGAGEARHIRGGIRQGRARQRMDDDGRHVP